MKRIKRSLIIIFIAIFAIVSIFLIGVSVYFMLNNKIDYFISALSLSVSTITLGISVYLNSIVAKINIDKSIFELQIKTNEIRNTLVVKDLYINKSLVPLDNHRKTMIQNKKCLGKELNKVLDMEIVFTCSNPSFVNTIGINKIYLIALQSKKLLKDDKLIISFVSNTNTLFDIKNVSKDIFKITVDCFIEKDVLNTICKEVDSIRPYTFKLVLSASANIGHEKTLLLNKNKELECFMNYIGSDNPSYKLHLINQKEY